MAEFESARVRYVTSKTSFAAGVERFARHDPAFAVSIEVWDTDPSASRHAGRHRGPANRRAKASAAK